MAMERCPNCAATLQVDKIKKIRFCDYCGSTFSLDDLTQTVRYIDEARLKEAQLKEKIFQAEQQDKERELRNEKKENKFRVAALLVLAFAVLMVFTNTSAPSVGLLFFAIIMMAASSTMKKSRGREAEVRNMDIPGSQNIRTRNSEKDRLITLLLCLFGGQWGLHYFYVGRIGKAILYIFTFGLFGIGIIVDIFLIACGKFKDREKRYVI